jgi:hypothetical protein
VNTLERPNYNTLIGRTVLLLLILIALLLRLIIFDREGGDYEVYARAVSEFTQGINPYIYTVESFRNPELDHGYAYMPTLLYIMSFMSKANDWLNTGMPWAVLWKIPVLVADIGVFVLLYRYFYKRSFVLAIIAGVLWLLNPYFLARYEYTLFDPIQIFFLLLSVTLLGKRDALSGLFLVGDFDRLVPLILFPLWFTLPTGSFVVLWTGIALVRVSMPFFLINLTSSIT